MFENEGISIKVVAYLLEEFSTVDALYEPARQSLPVTADSKVYDVIADNICRDSADNVMDRLPEGLSKLVVEMVERDPAVAHDFVRNLYNLWVDKGKPPCGDKTGIPVDYLL